MVKAVILAGGYATRLRPLTLTTPKPLLPILDKPLLDWIIEGLVKAGIKDIVLSVRYHSDKIKSRYNDGSKYGVNIVYAEEPKPLGDGGPIKFINEVYGLDETFLVVYGDVFSNIDYRKLLDFHRSRGSLCTMTLTRVEDPTRYGVAVLDENCRVIRFIEKPRRDEAPSNMVNAGIYVFEPEVLKYTPGKGSFSIARDFIPILLENRVNIYAYIHNGLWSDIGIPRDYFKANIQALKTFYPNGYIGRNVSIENAEIVNPTYISDNVVIGEGSRIGPYTIINPRCRLGKYTRIVESIILKSTIIDTGSVIKRSIIGEKVVIGKWVRVEENSIIGDEVALNDEVMLARNTCILPFKEVRDSIYCEGKIVL